MTIMRHRKQIPLCGKKSLLRCVLIIAATSVVGALWIVIDGVSSFCLSSASISKRPSSFTSIFPSTSMQTSKISLGLPASSMLRVATNSVSAESSEGAANTTTKSSNPPSKNSSQDGAQTGGMNTEDKSAGVVGNWENLHGNWVLRPTLGGNTNDFSNSQQPRAVIHFLGGALVGKAPHITYRYMLEKLADEGFLIVATPYDLSFDHLATCDDVLTKFEAVAPTLAKQYGALPVVGIGHSCGALLQVLISSLFPDTPRAANALLSFNNKPVSDAVPFFEEFFAPFFASLAVGPDMPSSSTPSEKGPSSNDSLVLGLKLAKAASQGKLPSDELLEEAQQVFGKTLQAATGQSSSSVFPIPFPPFFSNEKQQTFKIPTELREAYAKMAEPSISTLNELGVLPIIHETIVSLEQIPRLIDEVADGVRDFNPQPSLVRSAAGKAYRPRRTLIIGYKDDPIDESDEIEEVLKEARSITRMKRPMVEIDVERKELGGGHAAPLLAPPLDVSGRAEDLLGLDTAKERLGYTEAAETVEDLVRWLEEGNL